ncbi:MAG: esterase-like activity of phytase family protein [Erythrobacter sp.]
MKRPFLPALLLVVLLLPPIWLRAEVDNTFDTPVTLKQVESSQEAVRDGWQLRGVWEYDAASLMFGGYSALLALDDGRLQAFSDRGTRFTFVQPDRPRSDRDKSQETPDRLMEPQPVEASHALDLWDIESAARDPGTGQYWLGFENTHGFHRYSPAGEPDGVRLIGSTVNWASNSGAEAMARLRDGRFLVIPEGGKEGLIYPADPVTGVEATTFEYRTPISGFGITEAVQLPDGRLLILLRNVVWGIPPFEARLAIAEIPEPGDEQVLEPRIVLNLTQVAPPENYEGLAVRERGDGSFDLWIISDDNLSVMQRTLLVKLRFDPAKGLRAGAAAKAANPPKQTKQKARE